jgi:hypothetical protein
MALVQFIPPSLPSLPPGEETRQLAGALTRLYSVVFKIIEHAPDFVPVEVAEELQESWSEFNSRFKTSVEDLAKLVDPNTDPYKTLVANGLTGKTGLMKRSWVARLCDRFTSIFPREENSEQRQKVVVTPQIADTAHQVCEAGETIVKSIPGFHYCEEFLGITRQLIRARYRRWDA